MPMGATPDLGKTQDARSLSLREIVAARSARVRGNERQPTKTAGRILQAQLDRLPTRSSRGEGEDEAQPVPRAFVAYPADSSVGAHFAGFFGSKKTVQIGETTLKLPSVDWN